MEVLEKITTAVISRSFPNVTLEGAFEQDSRESLTIQICDVLLGAVMSEWAREPPDGAKKELRLFIAKHLGWDDLHSDTHPPERKFNIWMFYDAEQKRPRLKTRDVNLLYPLPPRRTAGTRRTR